MRRFCSSLFENPPFLGVLLSLALLVSGCSLVQKPASPALAKTPAETYAGEIPCADCAGQRLAVTLFPDGLFRLRQTYIGAGPEGRDAIVHDLGRWLRDQDGTRLMLRGGQEPARQFRSTAGGGLRLLDINGGEIVSDQNYELTRQASIDPVAGPMRLHGTYVYIEDAESFTECRTGNRYRVRRSAAHEELAQAFHAARETSQAPVLAVFYGHFVDGERGEPEDLMVDKFERVWPGGACTLQPPAKTAFHDTEWRLIEIDGKPLPTRGLREVPMLALASHGNTVRGSTGCNRVMGGYDDGASGFSLRGLATTRKACPGPTGELEMKYLSALTAVTTRRLVDANLELIDAEGTVRLRFAAPGAD